MAPARHRYTESDSSHNYDYSNNYFEESSPIPTLTKTPPHPVTAHTTGKESYFDDDDITQLHQEESKEPSKGLKGCLSGLCCGCCCCCCCNAPESPGTDHCNVLRVLPWLIVTAIYWAILWILASSYSPGNHQFTLNVGETWQLVPPSNLWSRTSLRIHSSTVNPGLEVYQFMPVLDYSSQPGQVTCPPLQGGAVLNLHEPVARIKMEMDEYQYDYFHLNQGSVLSVDARLTSVTSGATNLYLLQGYHALASLEEHDSIQDFRGESILKRFLGQGGSTVMEYTVPMSDYYIVVYDNAAAGVTKLDVAITVQLATHYLPDDMLPICGAKDTANSPDGRGCEWAMTNNDDRQRIAHTCLIVKAVSNKLKEAEDWQRQHGPIAPPPPGEGPPGGDPGPPRLPLDLDDTQVVTVLVDAPLGSPMLIFFAALPFAAMLGAWLMNHGAKCCQARQSKNSSLASSLRTTATSAQVLDHKLVVLGSADERIPLTGQEGLSYYSNDNTNGSSRRIFPMQPPTTQAVLGRRDSKEIYADGLEPLRPPQ
jgi:hypothetical protein